MRQARSHPSSVSAIEAALNASVKAASAEAQGRRGGGLDHPHGYVALIHKDAASDFGVSFPDLPGLVTAGLDLDDARRMAEEALALHLAGMAEDGTPIPEPSSFEAVMAERDNRDAVALFVNAPSASAKTVRVNMTLPKDDLRLIDAFAASYSVSRSAFLLLAAKRAIAAGPKWQAELRPERESKQAIKRVPPRMSAARP